MSIKLPQLLSLTFRLRNRLSESMRWNVLLKLNGEMVVYASTFAGIDPFCT